MAEPIALLDAMAPVALRRLPERLAQLSDSEFDRVWVAALATSVIECSDGRAGLGDLCYALTGIRDRYRRMNDGRGIDTRMHRISMAPAKLNELQVRIIRRIKGITLREIGGIFGVVESNVQKIRKGESWRFVGQA